MWISGESLQSLADSLMTLREVEEEIYVGLLRVTLKREENCYASLPLLQFLTTSYLVIQVLEEGEC